MSGFDFFNDGFSGVTGVPDSMFMVIRQVKNLPCIGIHNGKRCFRHGWGLGFKKSKEVISGCVQKFIACEDCCRCIQLLMEISQLVERNFSCLISIDCACMLRKEQVILSEQCSLWYQR